MLSFSAVDSEELSPLNKDLWVIPVCEYHGLVCHSQLQVLYPIPLEYAVDRGVRCWPDLPQVGFGAGFDAFA